ncbi:DUF1684 domain-containing protein [Fimbriiglobus ruber]|nr:DUF1684 domain-containing protein [Fimbriiglobus ruber]
MNRLLVTACVLCTGLPATAADPEYTRDLQAWRDAQEKSLRADNGWLTLAGRFPLKVGANTFGTGSDNDVVFPPELQGVGPDRLGTLHVDAVSKRVALKLAAGVTMVAGGKEFTGERVLGTDIDTDKRDWVGIGRLRMHIIVRGGRYIVRLADNESAVRKNFAGRVWYPANERFKVEATFRASPAGKTVRIVNVLGEPSDQPCPGYVEFKLDGETQTLDAIAEGEGLFIVFRDRTAGETSYKASRFLTVEKMPKPDAKFTLDFNRAYNPPCAFSEFTTCPLPPKQNILKIRVEAGEKYRGK